MTPRSCLNTTGILPGMAAWVLPSESEPGHVSAVSAQPQVGPGWIRVRASEEAIRLAVEGAQAALRRRKRQEEEEDEEIALRIKETLRVRQEGPQADPTADVIREWRS